MNASSQKLYLAALEKGLVFSSGRSYPLSYVGVFSSNNNTYQWLVKIKCQLFR